MDQITALTTDILLLQELELILPEFQSVDLDSITRALIEKYEYRAATRNVSASRLQGTLLPLTRRDRAARQRQ